MTGSGSGMVSRTQSEPTKDGRCSDDDRTDDSEPEQPLDRSAQDAEQKKHDHDDE